MNGILTNFTHPREKAIEAMQTGWSNWAQRSRSLPTPLRPYYLRFRLRFRLSERPGGRHRHDTGISFPGSVGSVNHVFHGALRLGAIIGPALGGEG